MFSQQAVGPHEIPNGCLARVVSDVSCPVPEPMRCIFPGAEETQGFLRTEPAALVGIRAQTITGCGCSAGIGAGPCPLARRSGGNPCADHYRLIARFALFHAGLPPKAVTRELPKRNAGLSDKNRMLTNCMDVSDSINHKFDKYRLLCVSACSAVICYYHIARGIKQRQCEPTQ